MIINYFKIAFRNFNRNKIFSAINVLGLSIGISAALVIFLIVHYEFSFDKFEKDNNRIYRVVIDAKFNGSEGHSTGVQAPLSAAIQNEVTGVDKTVPLMQFQGDANAKVSIKRPSSANVVIFKKQPNIIFTNQQYFQLLNYQFIAGSAEAAMKDPFSVVLTESRSQQYFPNVPAADVIGRQITYNDNLTATVSGIVKDLNEETVFTASEFISFATISKTNLVFQFLTETFFITVIATILSIIVTPFLLKMFADFIPQGLHFDLLHQPSLIVFLLLLTITVSFLSGVYPALILSGFRPALVLKNQVFTGAAQSLNAWVRKILTVSQFVIAQFFVIATIMVSKQINYSLNQDLGFTKSGIITFDAPRNTVAAHTKELLNAINAVPEVAIASTGFLSPADKGVAFTNISYEGRKDLKDNVQIRWGDPDYLKVYQIKLLAGRNVEPSDTMKEFLINDTYAKLL